MIGAVTLPDTNADAGHAPPQQLGLWDAATAEDWRVRESQRARRLAARVFFDGRVEIVVPRGTRRATIGRFVTQHRGWIERARRRVAQPRSGVTPAGSQWPPSELALAALDETWDCRHEPAGVPASRATLKIMNDAVAGQRGVLLVQAPVGEPRARAVLRDWLKRRAGEVLLPLLQALGAEMGCDFRRLQIRLQHTRWGSCSRRGTISLNACLLFQRPAVVRYLLVHELAHRRHMHHGPAFWKLVADHEPAWRALDRELLHGWRQVPHWVITRT
jgi:hypothetical protein